MKFFTKKIFLLILFLASKNLFSQNNKIPPYGVNLQLHYGYIYDHAHTMSGIVNSYIYSAQVEFSSNQLFFKQTNKSLIDFGIGIYYSELGNNQILGHSMAFYPYSEFPLFPQSFFSMRFKLASGLAYLTKTYSPMQNPYEASISSHLNVFVQLNFMKNIFDDQTKKISLGFALTHYSNGALKMPNLGINLVTLNSQFSFGLGDKEKIKKIFFDSIKNSRIYITPTFGWKQHQATGPNTFMVWDISLEYSVFKNPTHHLMLGTDFFYDPSWRDVIALNDSNQNEHDYNQGFHVGYNLQYNKLIYLANFGVYTMAKNEVWHATFHRIGFRYLLSKHLFFNFTLKSYWANAENIEWGFGLKF